MNASFEGAFPDIPLPNPRSGLSRIHVDATCLPASGGALWATTSSQYRSMGMLGIAYAKRSLQGATRGSESGNLTRLFCTRLLPQGSPFGSTFGGYNSTTPWSRFRALVVTFHLFNSFNTASYDLRNSQCNFQDNSSLQAGLVGLFYPTAHQTFAVGPWVICTCRSPERAKGNPATRTIRHHAYPPRSLRNAEDPRQERENRH